MLSHEIIFIKDENVQNKMFDYIGTLSSLSFSCFVFLTQDALVDAIVHHPMNKLKKYSRIINPKKISF